MSIGKLPRIGLKGQFTFTGPFEVYSGYIMEVLADKTIDYYATVDRDVATEVYKSNEIDLDTFKTHSEAGVRIITLRYHDRMIVDVPSVYIESIPDEDLGYRWFQMIASLGILPSDIDLTRVQQVIEEALLEYMGIETDVMFSASDVSDKMSLEDIETAEEIRKNAVANSSTFLKDKMMLEKEAENLRGQVDLLMKMIYV